MSSILQSAGVDLGKQLLPASEGNNARGFFENMEFVSFHEEVLTALGASRLGFTTKGDLVIPDSFGSRMETLVVANQSKDRIWGWKDPRTTLFMECWAQKLPDAAFLLVYRTPWEVVDSLFRRGDPDIQDNPRLALDMWTTYNKKVLEFARKHPERSLLVGLDAIIPNPQALVQALNKQFGFQLQQPQDLFEESLMKRESPSSKRAVLIKKFFPESYKVYEELQSLSFDLGQGKPEARDLEIDENAVAELVIQDWMMARKMTRDLKNVNQTLYTVRSDLYHVNEKLSDLERSRVWKIRNVVNRFRQQLSGSSSAEN